MEILLLWADELDDALGMLRHHAPRILGLIVALALFAATGFALVLAPQVAFGLFAAALSGTLVEAVPRRRARLSGERS